MTQKPNFDSLDESNPNKPSVADRTRTTNEAGGEAFEPFTPQFGLYKICINNLLEDSFYDDVDESFDKIWDRYDRAVEEDPEFVLQLAAYARNVEGLRDIPQLLLVMAANDERVVQPDESDVSLVRDYTPAIIDRTDEFNTVLSYQLRGYGKPVPKGLKKGIEDALHEKYVILEYEDGATDRITYVEQDLDLGEYEAVATVDQPIEDILDEGYVNDEYTFARYSQRDKEVSLHDVLNLVRPAPRSDDRDDLFGRIAQGELDDHPDVEPLREERTWESEMSEDDDRSDAEKFRERLDDMGLMARVRNLRNMRQAGLSGEEIFDYDECGVFGTESDRVVRNSKMFPFRLYQAFKACGDTGIDRTSHLVTGGTKQFDLGRGDLLDEFSQQWLTEAIDTATQNLPDSMENTFTAIDLSGSMDGQVSGHSGMTRAEIASLFGAMTMKRGSYAGAFGSDFALVNMDEPSREATSTLEITQRIYSLSEDVGNSTNGWKAIDWATENDVEYDRFVVFTDEQIWDSTSGLLRSGTRTLKSAWDDYTEQVNPEASLYLIDLASYGTSSMPEGYHNVHQISGWSESVVEFVDKNESADDVVREIEAVSPSDF